MVIIVNKSQVYDIISIKMPQEEIKKNKTNKPKKKAPQIQKQNTR